MRDFNWDKTIAGDTLLAIENTPEVITLRTNRHEVRLAAYGDCCSHSWFEHVDEVGAIGGQITEVTNEYGDGSALSDEKTDDYIEVQFFTLKTTKGRVHIEMRNSSNGYYGGSIEADVEAVAEAPSVVDELTEDFVATFSEPGETFTGGFAMCVAAGIIPLGVNTEDPRVQDIIRRCQEAA